ncbi:Nonaspanin [Fomes fomentarius]|nr:Nonaspanin [Fomes fomentarius]
MTRIARFWLLGGVALSLFSTAHAFYLPGAAPHDYHEGEEVDLFVNTLTPMIAGDDHAKLKEPESLGSILFGDRIFNSPYDAYNGTCKALCTVEVPPEDAKFINDRIREDYAINWLVDGLPAAEMKEDKKTGELFFDMGFNLGYDEAEFKEMPALHNHYDIVLRYHKPYPDVYRIVGVLVWPTSRGGSQEVPSDGHADCSSGAPGLVLSETQKTTVTYTYRVTWNESDTPWATRWDNYLHIFDPRIHWFSLINSVIVVVFLCLMVSMILLRTVSRDISRYNAMDLSEDVQEDWGWKLVHGEVFRTPQNPMVLSVLVGNGAQLCAMVGVTLGPSWAGKFSMQSGIDLSSTVFALLGFLISGYISSRMYASLGGTDKRLVTSCTCLLCIHVNDGVGIPIVSICLGTILLVIVLWFGISAPLSAVGSFFGSKHGAVTHPVRVNQIPRQIPPQPKYLKPWAATILAGILPFGAAFIELYFVLSSLFASRAYYAFGFLALTAAVVALTTATVTILFTYFILCAEDYRWHWRAFLTGGGSAFWLLAYGVVYWALRLSLDSMTSVVLYMGYLLLLALFDFLITGTIGFLATYWAVRRLYSAIRVD